MLLCILVNPEFDSLGFKLRFKRIVLLILLVVLVILGAGQARAQQPTSGSVCVLVYNDANNNKQRDSGESLVSSVNVDLMVQQTVIIGNHITDGQEPYCFNNLSPRQYAVSVSSPYYVSTSPSIAIFSLNAGDKINKEFGVIPGTPPTPDSAAPDDSLGNILSTPIRIGVAGFGAIMAMIFMTAVGFIIYGLFLHRRPPKRPKPQQLPPQKL